MSCQILDGGRLGGGQTAGAECRVVLLQNGVGRGRLAVAAARREAAVDGRRRRPRQLLIDNGARQMVEVRAIGAGQHGTRPHSIDGTRHFGIGDAQGINRRRDGARREPTRHRHAGYVPAVNMMCALGVPGNISHGVVADDFVDSPVLASVANGM